MTPLWKERPSIQDLAESIRPTFPCISTHSSEVEPSCSSSRSLLRKYDEGGILPMSDLASNYTGCMIGYHAVPVIVDAYIKGLRDYDLKNAMEAVVASSVYDDKKPIPYHTEEVKKDLMPKAKLYNATMGYIPADLELKSVSKALEFAYNDWNIATMAKGMGREDVAKEYSERAGRYRTYLDKESGFMRGKNQDGSWVTPFTPTDSNHNLGEYTEGNAWQWTWFAPHDVPGLIELFGGKEPFAKKINELFTTGLTYAIEESTDAAGRLGGPGLVRCGGGQFGKSILCRTHEFREVGSRGLQA